MIAVFLPPTLKSCPIVPLFVSANVMTAFFFTVFGVTANLNSDMPTVTRCGVADAAVTAPSADTATASAARAPTPATRTILLTMPPDLDDWFSYYDDTPRPD